MKRRDLIIIIRGAAKAQGLSYTLREGGAHSRVTVGSAVVSIPRHSEIATRTVRSIVKALESELGRGWSGYER